MLVARSSILDEYRVSSIEHQEKFIDVTKFKKLFLGGQKQIEQIAGCKCKNHVVSGAFMLLYSATMLVCWS
jgi:hypothetical protein